MIAPEQIRIGNLLFHSTEWNAADIHGVFAWEQRHWFMEAECILSFEDISPIPLTEEWLVKFGVGNRQDYVIELWAGERIRSELILRERVESYTVYILDVDSRPDQANDCVMIKDIKYVHQLQNLFFALVGQELQLKTTV